MKDVDGTMDMVGKGNRPPHCLRFQIGRARERVPDGGRIPVVERVRHQNFGWRASFQAWITAKPPTRAIA
jgi:hypothetical protein